MRLNLPETIDGAARATADPFIFENEGKFYLYATGGEGIDAYTAEDVFGTWEFAGTLCKTEGARHFWAPSVIRLGDEFWVYVSYDTDTTFERMHAFCGPTPLGPFEDRGELYPRFSIDSHAVQTDAGLFLFYAEDNLDGQEIGTRIFVDKMETPDRAAGICCEILVPTHKEEMFQANRNGDGRDWYTLEGPFWFQEGEWQYLMFSGGCFMNDTYHIGYASAKTTEQDLTKVTFEKHTLNGAFDPVLIRNDVEEGTGHHSVIKLDGQWYAIYHGRDIVPGAPETTDDLRNARICKLEVADGVIRAVRM